MNYISSKQLKNFADDYFTTRLAVKENFTQTFLQQSL